MSEPDDVRTAIEELKAAGFRISIDDFGTGYSSLSTLQRLPVDRLKLDRSFLEEVQGDSEARQVMEGIMLLADHLKLEVVAEGIETVQHLRRVRGMHCPFGQGYLFSRPGPPGPNSLNDLPGEWSESGVARANEDVSQRAVRRGRRSNRERRRRRRRAVTLSRPVRPANAWRSPRARRPARRRAGPRPGPCAGRPRRASPAGRLRTTSRVKPAIAPR